MNGSGFEGLMRLVFAPFLARLGLEMQPVHVSGRYYRASFIGNLHTLLVTYEPGDDKIIVMLITNGDDDLRSIDDPARTPRLSHLNARYMSRVTAADRAENEAFFEGIESNGKAERALVKCAKDLRLVLPIHLAASNA